MKQILIILIFLTFSLSFGQDKESKIYSVFKECNESKIKEEKEYLIQEYGDKVLTKTKEETVLQLFELFLINKNLLSNKSKKSYIELFEKIQNNEVESGLQEKFYNELDFGTYNYFNPSKSCYGYLYQLKLINENSWQYKVVVQFDKFESEGGYRNYNTDFLIKAVKTVPTESFLKLYNRRIFLNWIFIGLVQND